MVKIFPFISIGAIMLIFSCRKDSVFENIDPAVLAQMEQDSFNDSVRTQFVGDWVFTFTHYFEGFVWSQSDSAYIFTMSSDTIWVKQGNIVKDPLTFDQLIVDYGINENPFNIKVDVDEASCVSDCQNAGWDTIASSPGWWYLSTNTTSGNSAIYNLGFYECYNCSDNWNIKGFPTE